MFLRVSVLFGLVKTSVLLTSSQDGAQFVMSIEILDILSNINLASFQLKEN